MAREEEEDALPSHKQPLELLLTTDQRQGLKMLEREIEAEASKHEEVTKQTRLDYEAMFARWSEGHGLADLAQSSRDRYKLAVSWMMRKKLKATLKEAKKLLNKGTGNKELFGEREMLWAAKLEEARELKEELHDFRNSPKLKGPKRGKQATHKQRPATDDELAKLHAWASTNSAPEFVDAFLVAEFAGVRGEELGKGVRVEIGRSEGVQELRFYIESAKCDEEKGKGIPLRKVVSGFPADASEEVKRRWLALSKKVAATRTGFITIKLDPVDPQVKKGKGGVIIKDANGNPVMTKGSSVGRRFTEAVRTAAEGAGVNVAAYSFRHRFASQLKEAVGGEENAAELVALALGHSTTKTGVFYARASRGGKGISRMKIKGVNIEGQVIRGDLKRTGPPLHVKEKAALKKATAKAPKASQRGARL